MHWADRNLKAMGDFDAFISGNTKQTSAEASENSRRLASALIDCGLAPTDRVLMWLPNGPDLTTSWRAVIRAGGITVVAHHDAPLKRIEQVIAETSPTTIITSQNIDGQLKSTTIRHRIHATQIDDLISRHQPLIQPVARAGGDVASIVHTSGTTGEPKGVVTRHDALIARMKKQRPRFAHVRRALRHLVVLPMSSAFGSSAFTQGLAQRCTLYFLEDFDPAKTLAAIERYRIQQTFLVPAMCEALLALPCVGDYDVTSLRTVLCSGSAVSPELARRFQLALGVRLQVGYGMSGVGAVSRTRLKSNPGSVGRMRPGLKARVEDSAGRPTPPGEVGELVLRLGDGAAVEHWNADASVTSVATPGKWYRTGDLVRFDSRGELHVVRRGDDLIIQGGHNINGEFVAEVVQRIDGVHECAVTGVPSDFLGQEAVACVVLDEDARLTAGDILAHCRLHLEPHSVPGSVWFVESLPRTELGKVKLHELRSTIRTSRGTTRDTEFLRQLRAAPRASRYELVRTEVQRLLEEVLRTGIGPASTTFRSMGLDSLGSIELTHSLSESIGRLLPATLTYTYTTVEEVSAFLVDQLEVTPGRRDRFAQSPKSHRTNEEPHLHDFFSSSDLETARTRVAETRTANSSRSIFLTGANGFLGRFLVLELLDQIAGTSDTLHCLVRAQDDSAALERMRRAYATNPILQQRLDSCLSANKLKVLAGDFTRSRFGLSDDAYDQLSSHVDCIIHNGAVVDHMLGYDELYAPNVLGTVEVMRFALTGRLKRINYISTPGAQSYSSANFARQNGGVATGYVASKWASERLLTELQEISGWPVRVYRPGYILAHRAIQGQMNTRDTLTRLLQSIVITSLAPASFYEGERDTRVEDFDGLPVDVVAKSVAAASTCWNSGENHDDRALNQFSEVNLDAVTDWIRSAGYRVNRVEKYSDWHREFANRLCSLKGPQRQHSLLPLVHAWDRPLRRPNRSTRKIRDAERQSHDSAVNEAFIHKCLDDMRVLGLIGPVE